MNTEIPMAMATPPGPNIGLIAFDLTCTSCGYNLRGLRENGRCPECANPIERSLRGDLLQFADPTWLKKLHVGVRMMLWYIVIYILLILLGGVVGAAGIPMIYAMLPAFAAAIFYIVAVFCLTTQEPRDTGGEESVTLRNIIRASVLLACTGDFIEFVGAMLATSSVPEILSAILQITGLVAMVGIFVYLRRFALRIPDKKLAQSTRTVMWGLVGSLFFILVIGIVAAVAGAAAAGPGAIFAILGGVGCVGGIGMLVFGIWTILLLFKYRDAFKLAADQSAGDLAARQQAPPTDAAL